MKCVFDATDIDPGLFYIQINDQNIYEFTCRNGHRNIVIHQVEKFELLFESASNAIMDGYFRDAVSSIAASLERLYEFTIKVISVENDLPLDQVEKAWKQVSKQSERQLGAFIFQYLSKFKTMPPLLHNKQVEFRNDVIHKGYFPSYEETIDFGEIILELMFEIVFKLKQECETGIQKVIQYGIEKMHKQAREITDQPIIMASPSIIDLRVSANEFKPIKLVNYLQSREKRR
jgi:hypothetical protein